MSYAKQVESNARLRLLQELARETDGRLNAVLLRDALDTNYGINRDRDWVETQLRKLENVGGVSLTDSGVVIASITPGGRDHLAQRMVLVGVTRPSAVA